MNLWGMGGMNPKFKDFIEKYPDKTMLGVSWALYWRLMVLVLIIELAIVIAFLIIGGLIATLA